MKGKSAVQSQRFSKNTVLLERPQQGHHLSRSCFATRLIQALSDCSRRAIPRHEWPLRVDSCLSPVALSARQRRKSRRPPSCHRSTTRRARVQAVSRLPFFQSHEKRPSRKRPAVPPCRPRAIVRAQTRSACRMPARCRHCSAPARNGQVVRRWPHSPWLPMPAWLPGQQAVT